MKGKKKKLIICVSLRQYPSRKPLLKLDDVGMNKRSRYLVFSCISLVIALYILRFPFASLSLFLIHESYHVTLWFLPLLCLSHIFLQHDKFVRKRYLKPFDNSSSPSPKLLFPSSLLRRNQPQRHFHLVFANGVAPPASESTSTNTFCLLPISHPVWP